MRQAVIVGIGDYGGSASSLANPTRDASSVARVLEGDYGFQCTVLLDGAATRRAVERAVSEQLVGGASGAGGQWLFYFAGHGLPPAGGESGGLLLHDPEGALGATLSVAWLCARCLESGFLQALLIFDNCYSAQALVRTEELLDSLPSDSADSRRVRQVICAGGPRQPVLDGGAPSHSVFTQCLLESLAGWSGVQKNGGEIRFSPLLEHLKEEVDRRLRALEVPETDRQETIGGSLVGTSDPLGFVLRPTVPRLSGRTVRWARSGDPDERLRALDRAFEEAGSHPERRLMAVELALRSIPASGNPIRLHSGVEVARVADPEAREREEAARLLGELAGRRDGVAGLPRRAQRRAAAHLLLLALRDHHPRTRHRARAGLRRLGAPARTTVGRIARRLATRRHSRLRSRAWEVAARLPEGRKALPLPGRWRALGTVSRLGVQQAWRIATATPTRRRLLAAPGLLALLLYGYLASSFYLSPVGGWVGVRAGHPGLTVLPGAGRPLLVTGFAVSQVEDRTLVDEERLRGYWLPLRHGALPWADRLLAHLEPADSGLGYWRLGEAERAFDRLAAGVAEGDARSVEIAGYLGLQSEDHLPRTVDLLVEALEAGDELAVAARNGLDALAATRPDAVVAPLDSLVERLDAASEAESVALLEAVQRLQPTARVADPARLQELVGQLARAVPESEHETHCSEAVAALLEGRVEVLPAMAQTLARVLSGSSLEARKRVLSSIARGLAESSGLGEPELPSPLANALVAWVAEREDAAESLSIIQSVAPLVRRSAELTARFVPVLSRHLRSPSTGIRLQAAEAILDFPSTPEARRRAVSVLSDLLREGAPSRVHTRVIDQVRELTSPAEIALVVDALVSMTADHDRTARAYALETLIDLELRSGIVGARLHPMLVAALDDPGLWMQRQGAEGLLLLRDRLGESDSRALIPEAVTLVAGAINSTDPASQIDARSLAQRLALTASDTRRRFLEDLASASPSEELWQGFAVRELLEDLFLAEPALVADGARFGAHLVASGGEAYQRGISLLWMLGDLPPGQVRPALRAVLAEANPPSSRLRAGAPEAAAYLAARHADLSAEVVGSLLPLAADPDPGLRLAVVRALWVLAESQPTLSRWVIPTLLEQLGSREVLLRTESARALVRIGFDEASRPLVLRRLAERLSDESREVRAAIARALRRWAVGYRPARRWAAPVRAALRREPSPAVRSELASTLGVLAGRDQILLSESFDGLDRALASGDEDLRSLALGGLWALGSGNRHSAPQALERIGAQMLHPDRSLVRQAILAARDTGRVDPDSGRIALDLLAERLFDPSWELAWDTVVNGIGPICRAHPELLDPGIEVLERYLPRALRDPDPRRRHLASSVKDTLLDLHDLASREDPERLWRLLESHSPSKAEVGAELLARRVDREPDRIPEARVRLAPLRDSLRPRVRFAAARGAEAATLLQETHESLGSPERSERWRRTLEGLPEVGIRPVVLLALDRLEPGVEHR